VNGVNQLSDALGLTPKRAESIIRLLKQREETVATAESLTGGLVCAVLTSVPGASAVVRGGVVVYATDLKANLAGVNGRALYEYGAVHPFIAEELARGAAKRCGADWGVGLTGVAGPDPQEGVAPGTVHIGLASGTKTVVRTIEVTGERHAVRMAAVDAALGLLLGRLDRPAGRNVVVG
jgi:nicotinamide-nucleotide amidase